MVTPFEFATAGRIVFGRGKLPEAVAAARQFGRAALVVTGRDPSRAGRLIDLLQQNGLTVEEYAVAHEPTVDDVVAGLQRARQAHTDLVIGFGGGSPIDAAKAIAVLLTNPGDPLDYLEVVGAGRPLAHPALPCIAIPTTAGTGAEVTRNAVLGVPMHRVKVSVRGPFVLPRLAIVDPELTDHLPPALTAATGLDALTQLIEPYVSCRANPLVDGFCAEGIPRAARSLRRAVEEGTAEARDDMALASLLGGLALANAGLGAVHGFAGPIGGMSPAPHGAVCAALLPHVMAANLAALRARETGNAALRRYDEVARLLTGNPHASADEGVAWVRALTAALQIPTLRSYGLTREAAPAIVAAAAKASSMKANPLPLTAEELDAIFAAAL